MLNEKVLDTRIILKHANLADWQNENSLILKEGEVALAKVETNKVDPITGEVEVPTYLIKVGDGTSHFSQLKWVAAPAADVYNWAKQNKFFVGEAVVTTTTTEAEGDKPGKTYVGNAITNMVWDATLNEGKGGLKPLKETQFATKAELDAALDAFGGDLDAITDNNTKYTFAMGDGDNAGKLAITEVTYVNGNAGAQETKYIDILTKDELDNLLIDYVKTVDKKDGTAIEVDNTDDQNPRIGLKIATTQGEGVTVTQTNDGLKVEVAHPALEIVDKTNVDTDAEVYAVTNLVEDNQAGHKVTPTYTAVPTKKYVDDAVEAGRVDYTVTVTARDDEAGDDHNAFKHYIFTQCGEEIAHIDIPRDLVVEEGHVKEVEEADKPYAGAVVGEKYIELKIKNQEELIYIPAKDLVEYISVEDTDTIDLTLSADHVLTADLKDNAVTTNKIVDKNVTLAKLDDSIQETLGKADTALQEVVANDTDDKPSGIKVSENNKIEIDDGIVWIFDCGGAM